MTTSAPDFSVFYTATYAFIHNKNPYTQPDLYTGVGYPPVTLLMFIPFSLLPYQLAQEVFILISAFCVVGSVYLSLRIIEWKLKYYYVMFLVALAFLMFPTKFTLGMGQSNSIVLVFLLLTMYFIKRSRSKLSGILFGLAVVMKPITLFLILFILIIKKWQVLMYALLTVLFCIVISLYFTDISYYQYYLYDVFPHLVNLTGREIYYNQGIMGFISRITSSNDSRFLQNVFFSLALLLLTDKMLLKRSDNVLGFGLMLILLVLVDTLSWQHHFMWLIFPFVIVLKEAVYSKSIVQFVVLFSSYLLVSLNIKNPQDYQSAIILSHVFIGSMYLYVLYSYMYLKINNSTKS